MAGSSSTLLGTLLGLAVALFLLPSFFASTCLAASISGKYTDPAYFTSIPWGSRSDWIQPWRSFIETPLASAFTENLGFNLATGQLQQANASLMIQQLSKYGFKHARLEIGWGSLDYNTEAIPPTGFVQNYLDASRQFGVRPLLLLNTNSGRPCPALTRTCVPLQNEGGFANSTRLSNIADLAQNPTYSGISDTSIVGGWGAQALFLNITNNDTAALSSPLYFGIIQNIPVTVMTLKYRPFGPKNGSDYANTMAGWKKYSNTVASQVASKLGTTANAQDKGFDLEVYNELTFGQHFLSINYYYINQPYAYPNDFGGPLDGPASILLDLVRETAAEVSAKGAELYAGVRLSDGFTNTQPWTGSSLEPMRVTALNKHPYRAFDYHNVPGQTDTTQKTSKPINALLQEDTSGFMPSYTSCLPEYYGTAIQTETLIRDSGPIVNTIRMGLNGSTVNVPHGRTARGDAVPVWVTEWSMFCEDVTPTASAEACLYLQAKNYLRFAAFSLNKGVERVYFFAAGYGDKRGGMVSDAYVNYTAFASSYPSDDSAYVSPTLQVFSRVIAKMGISESSVTRRSLGLADISDTHDHFQFEGNGTSDPAHPPLYNREVFAFLPYQTSSSSFAVFYYVMTRNTAQVYNAAQSGGKEYDMPEESYDIVINGVDGESAKSSVSAYDPFTDATVPVTVLAGNSTTLTLRVSAYDNPRLLLISEVKSIVKTSTATALGPTLLTALVAFVSLS